MFCFMTSRRKTPSGRVFSASIVPGLLDRNSVFAEVGQAQRLLQPSAVGVRIGAHAACAGGSQLAKLLRRTCRAPSNSSSGFCERIQFSSRRSCSGSFFTSGSGTWCARQKPSSRWPSTSCGRRPALGRAQHDHRPVRPRDAATAAARVALDLANLVDAVLHRRGHGLVHAVVVGAFDEVRRPAVAAHQALQLLVRNARQQRRIVDLVAVQMEDRQHRAVAHRVEKLVDVPRGRQRSGLRFAVAHDRRDDQLRIVESRAAGVRQDVSQLAAFVDRARRLRRAMAANAAGEAIARARKSHSDRVDSVAEEYNTPGRYDVIFTIHVLEHMRDPLRALENMYQSLKQPGFLLAVCPNYDVPLEPHLGIFLVGLSKSLNARIYARRIATKSKVWDGLFFVRYSRLRQYLDENRIRYAFNRSMVRDMFQQL